MTETTLLLILDAGRSDYASRPEVAPFLAHLAESSRRGEGESPPGFAQRTCMFTGTYPDTSGNFSAFGYNPENSPFKWVRRLGPVRHLYQPRKIVFPARVGVKHLTRAITGAYHTDPAWIPATYLPYFEVVEDQRPIFEEGALPFQSIFDLCRAHDKQFFYGAHPVSGDDDEIHKLLLKQIENKEPIDLYVGQFSVLDEGGHHHGPLLEGEKFDGQSDKDVRFMEKALREVDNRIATIVGALERNYDKVNLLILGDHGMAPVRRRVNILKELKSTGLKPGKDYVVFVDSTYAKIWFRSDEAKKRIPEMLSKADYGHTLTDEERDELRIRFDHRRYGDIMFAADVGVLFWPDYFHVVEHHIQGMHGYVDKEEETYSMLLLKTPGGGEEPLGRRILVDVFPTLCDLLGFPVPDHNEGESLVDQRALEAPIQQTT